MKDSFFNYIGELKVKYEKSKIKTYIFKCIGIFISLLLLNKIGDLIHVKLLIAPFGASCVILFGFPESQFSNPIKIIGGYLICSVVGIIIHRFCGDSSIGIALAVSLAVLIMMFTNLTHPPAGAVTIIAVTAGTGWMFILIPVVLGAFVIIIVALLYNKIHVRIGKSTKLGYQYTIPEIEVSE